MDWQPIETAPKDGNDILLWAAPDEQMGCAGIMDMVYWGGGEHGWIACSPAGGVFFSRCPSLYTHWMPLPAPPSSAKPPERD